MRKQRDNFTPSGTKERKPSGRILQRPIKEDWSKVIEEAKELGMPTFSPLLEPHMRPSGLEEAKALAYELGKKPYSKWTAEEMQKAMNLLGAEGVSILRDIQERKRRGY